MEHPSLKDIEEVKKDFTIANEKLSSVKNEINIENESSILPQSDLNDSKERLQTGVLVFKKNAPAKYFPLFELFWSTKNIYISSRKNCNIQYIARINIRFTSKSNI